MKRHLNALTSNNDLNFLRKQYALGHNITGKAHSSMGDTCNKMDKYVSDVSKPSKLWDRGQLIVLLSRTRSIANAIFVSSKRDKINASENY